MSKARVEILKIQHIGEMQLRESEKAYLSADPRAKEKLNALVKLGVGGTIFKDNLIIGIIGYYQLWEGVYEVWAFPSTHVSQHAMTYLRMTKRYIQMMEKTHNVKRFQTLAIADDLHDRWMRFLGFTNETPNGMREYSIFGQTFNLWSRIPARTV